MSKPELSNTVLHQYQKGLENEDNNLLCELWDENPDLVDAFILLDTNHLMR